MEALHTFGDRVRWARTTAGITQRELDRRAGYSGGFTGIIEARAGAAPQTSTVERYARALGVGASWLAFGEGAAPDGPALERLGAETRSSRQTRKAAA